jgi:transcriptional regulator with XRE-family HTH domain
MTTIADRLREFRTAVGLTQREVANMCGLGKRTVIYWEMGDREIKCSKLVPLNREYDLDFNWLILGTGSMFIRHTAPQTQEESATDLGELAAQQERTFSDEIFTPAGHIMI